MTAECSSQAGQSSYSRPTVLAVAKASIVVALTAALAAIVTEVSLRLSFASGRLSVPPLYDDVVYFVSAARWLATAPGRSIGGNLYALFDQHSPFTTLAAAIGLKWMPGNYVGPYAFNGIVIAAFMLGVAWLVWRRSVLDIATCLIGVACVPMLSQTVTEARPDLPWGLGMGVAIGALFRRPLLGRSYASLFLIGLFCGVVVALKPSAFPASVACLGFAACAATLSNYLETTERGAHALIRHAIATLVPFGCGLIVGAAAIMGVSFAQTVRYILKTMVYHSDLWATPGDLYYHLTFYSVGPAGSLALNVWFWIGLMLFAVRLSVAWFRDRTDVFRALALLSVVLVAYAIPTASIMKTYFLGSIFYGPFVVAMVLNYMAIVDGFETRRAGSRAVPGWLGTAARFTPLGAMALIFVGVVALGRVALATSLDRNSIADIRTATERVWSLLLKNAPQGPTEPSGRHGSGLVAAFSSPFPVTSSAIELYAVQARVNLDARGAYFFHDLDEAVRNLSSADFAIITSSIPHNLPGPRMGDELIRRLDAEPGMCLVDSMPLLTARVMRIYRRSATGCVSGPHQTPQ
jgi:hypothetical protein